MQITLEPPRKRFLKRRGNDEDKNIVDEERKKRWAEEALRERRKRFQDHYNQSQIKDAAVEKSTHQDQTNDFSTQDQTRHQYLVDIEENEVEEYEAFLDDIIENAYDLPLSKKRKERPDDLFQFEKENDVPSSKTSKLEIRKQSSSQEPRTVLAEFNQLHSNVQQEYYNDPPFNNIATDIHFREQTNTHTATGVEPLNSFATDKDQNHLVLESPSEPTMLNGARNGNTAIVTIKNFHRNDVICERKGSFCNHPGNIYFQKLVKERLQKYRNSRKLDKRSVATEVVDLIRKLDPPGRFLKKHEFICGYVDIGDVKANEKTTRALRDENYLKSLAENASNRKKQNSIVLPDTNITNIDLHDKTSAMNTMNVIGKGNDQSSKDISLSQRTSTSIAKEGETPQLLEPRPSALTMPPRNEKSTLIAQEDIHEHDVLCGRGGSVGAHPGNKYFQKLVKERKQRYLNSRKLEKKSVATEVVELIQKRNPPGRFLKRDESSGFYIEITNSKANEKARQALRENAPSLRSQMEHEAREFVRSQMEHEAREIEIGERTVNTPATQD
ncbi:hypothetical protein CTEN210_00310 [Chaetoceros tenuissimus]|uniref:DUF6824 domain-containing protein n=1 Tax=Chaetoceros tenuissimus TaxID=426638 RepID=A0AAD3CCZ3_9STRA|nr:hypothetical protein CTEN210_00310 [Chaetoceros tenuissimus]